VDANEQQDQFQRLVMPHLDAAFNLARWLTGNDHDAQDIAQEACMRAFRFVSGCRAADGRAWLLAIVRNTAFSWLKRNRSGGLVPLNDDEHTEIEDQNGAARAVYSADTAALRAALETLPLEFREALVLRELEGLSYKEISDVTEVAVGTVMSRLARARRQLQLALNRKGKHELH
jgi:RNA polymerase sigma-70 factor (ECF subfamily)